MTDAWHPYDEAEAASARTAFIEWLRATHRLDAADPAAIMVWKARDPAGFTAAITDFAGLDPSCPPAWTLFRPEGAREALVLHRPGARQAWSRDALRAGTPPLPTAVAATLAALDWAGLVEIAWCHLLGIGTRPDDRLLWTGPLTDRLPYGALLLGATLVLVDDPSADHAALARAEEARPITPPGPVPAPG